MNNNGYNKPTRGEKNIFCINSVIKAKKKYDVVVVDECESLLKHCVGFKTPLDNCYYTLVDLAQKAEKVILLDYSLGNMTL